MQGKRAKRLEGGLDPWVGPHSWAVWVKMKKNVH